MPEKQGRNNSILITGGTSGLGQELVRLFLKRGYNVVATGRKKVNLNEADSRLTIVSIDFSDLNQVSSEIRTICRDHSFDLIINNAGILSPPEYTETTDGFEYTFQVNFLAHLLLNEIILNEINDRHKITIATVSSPVYRFASLKPGIEKGGHDYRPMRSYSTSKFYLALMYDLLVARHKEKNLTCFSFDPGTFRSEIFRMQKKWFRFLYRVAAPFMRSPAKVATILAELISEDKAVNGKIYDCSKHPGSTPVMTENKKASFTESCYSLIDPFLH